VSEPERPGVFDHEIAPVEPPHATEAVQEPGAGEPDPPPQSDETPPPGPETGSAAPEPPPAPPVTPPAAQDIPAHVTGGLQVPAGVRVFGGSPNGARRSVGIAVSRFNGEITSKLLEGALGELEASGVAREAIEVMPVPGAFELPLAAMALAKSRRYSCVLALGCVIRGETPHFEFVSAEAASGVQLAGLETGIPVAFGVLTCDTAAQAEARAGGALGNKGVEAARSALEMVESLTLLRSTLSA
jgi:6,7-dimethyl-8-ribityllumazine synthase